MSNHYTVNITSYIWNHGKYNNSDEYVNEILNGIDTSGDFVLVIINYGIFQESFSIYRYFGFSIWLQFHGPGA